MKVIIFSILCIALSLAEEIKEEDGVLVLTDKNFDQALKTYKYLFVDYYAPWCPYCKRLAPEFAKAAKILKEAKSDIKLGKVDGTVEHALKRKIHLRGYPTLKFYRKGSRTLDYRGRRTADSMVNWLKSQAGK